MLTECWMARSVAADPLVGSAWTHGRVGVEERGSTGRTPANGGTSRTQPDPLWQPSKAPGQLEGFWEKLTRRFWCKESLSKPHTTDTPLRCPGAVPSWQACFVTDTPLALRALPPEPKCLKYLFKNKPKEVILTSCLCGSSRPEHLEANQACVTAGSKGPRGRKAWWETNADLWK